MYLFPQFPPRTAGSFKIAGRLNIACKKVYNFIRNLRSGGMNPNGKSFWFLCMRDSEARVFFRFCPPRGAPRVPFLLPNARRKAKKKSSPQELAISAK